MKILWIDDEPHRFDRLKPTKLSVVFAHGQAEIDQYFNSGIKFDGMILDHDMPKMNGMDVLKTFILTKQNLLNPIPIVLCSANNTARVEMLNLLKEISYPVLNNRISYRQNGRWIWEKDFRKKTIQFFS